MTTGNRKLDLGFCAGALGLLVGLAWTFSSDHRREWKAHQREYREMAAGASRNIEIQKAMRDRPIEIGQVFLQKPLHVDRCVSCHMGFDNPDMEEAPEPYRTHPSEILERHPVRRFGCTVCHGGQGTATTYRDAGHDPIAHWDDPILPIELTEARCGTCHAAEAMAETPLLAEGRDLMRRKGCYGCHRIPGMEELKKPGPALGSAGVKTGRHWLRGWIADPARYLENARMPTFRLAPEQANALAEYLVAQVRRPLRRRKLFSEMEADSTKGKAIFGVSRCISCHAIEGKGGTLGADLSRIGDKADPQWLFEWLLDPHYFEPATEMARFGLSPAEAADLAAYLLEELTETGEEEQVEKRRVDALPPSPEVANEGLRLFSELGCIGCHDVDEPGKVKRVGPDLDGIGSIQLASLSFGEHRDVSRRRDNWLFLKVLEPAFEPPEAKMPDFRLSEDEAARIAIALMAIRRTDLAIERPMEAETRSPYVPAGLFGNLIRKYRCLVCHQIAGQGGTLSTVDLRYEGSRVRREWLFSYLKVPYAVRPMLVERMPRLRMTDEEAKVFVDVMMQVFVDDAVPDMDGETFGDEERDLGRKLFEEKGCPSCHTEGGEGGGYVGPDLSFVGDRLRPGWMYAWLMDPMKFKSGGAMPVYGFSDEEARALVGFLLEQKRRESVPAQTVPRGP